MMYIIWNRYINFVSWNTLWTRLSRMAGIQFPCPRWPRSKYPTSHSFGYCYLTIILFLLHLSFMAAQSTDIFQPPVITEPYRQQTLYHAENRKVTIQCTAHGKPTPVYTWKKDGKMITKNRYILFDTKSGLLTINSFTVREEGIYVCLSTNVVGGSHMATSESQPQTLKAIRVEPFKRPTEPSNNTFTVSEYSYISLKCSDRGTVVGPTDDISYNWYIKTDSSQVLMDGGRLYISIDGSLHFTYTLSKDEFENENSYHCGIRSNSLQLIQFGNPVILKVQEATPKAIRTNVVYTNNGLQATVATSAELECIVSGYDPIGADKLPVIRWYDDAGVEIKSDGIKYTLKHNNRRLVINDVQEMDEKAYQCQGTSAWSSRRTPVFLNVTAPPIWVQAPRSTTVPEGANVVINCNARSLAGEQPPHQPQWKINGRNFEEVRKDNVAVSSDRKSMTFNNVTKDKDILCVQCLVQNSVGQTMGEACINVIFTSQDTIRTVEFHEKSTLEINCNAQIAGVASQYNFIRTVELTYGRDRMAFLQQKDGTRNNVVFTNPRFQADLWIFTLPTMDQISQQLSSTNPNRALMSVIARKSDAKCTDEGIYTCTVDYCDENSESHVVWTKFNFTGSAKVSIEPIRISPKNNGTVYDMDEIVTLTCLAKGPKEHEFQWQKKCPLYHPRYIEWPTQNDIKKNVKTEILSHGCQTYNHRQELIFKTELTLSGCEIKCRFGKRLKNGTFTEEVSSNLKITVNKPITRPDVVPKVGFQEGSTLVINCNAHVAKVDSRYKLIRTVELIYGEFGDRMAFLYHKDGTRAAFTETGVRFSQDSWRFTVPSEADMSQQLDSANPSRELMTIVASKSYANCSNEGKYKCIVNYYTENTDSQTVMTETLYSAMVSLEPMKIIPETCGNFYDVNVTLTLTCTARGPKAYDFQWQRKCPKSHSNSLPRYYDWPTQNDIKETVKTKIPSNDCNAYIHRQDLIFTSEWDLSGCEIKCGFGKMDNNIFIEEDSSNLNITVKETRSRCDEIKCNPANEGRKICGGLSGKYEWFQNECQIRILNCHLHSYNFDSVKVIKQHSMAQKLCGNPGK